MRPPGNQTRNIPLAIRFDPDLQSTFLVVHSNPRVAQSIISLQTRVLHRYKEVELLRDFLIACPNLGHLAIMIATQRMLQHVADVFKGMTFESLSSFYLYAGMINYVDHDIDPTTPRAILGSMPNLRQLGGSVATDHDDDENDVSATTTSVTGGLILENYRSIELSDSGNNIFHSQLAVVATVQHLLITVADEDIAEHLPQRVSSAISRSRHDLRSVKVDVTGYIPDYALRLPKPLGTVLALCTRLQTIELPCRVPQNVPFLFNILEHMPPGLLILTISEWVDELLHELVDAFSRMACMRTLRRLNLDGSRKHSDTAAMDRVHVICHARRTVLNIIKRQYYA